MGFPVDASVKFTTSGEQPETGVAVKLASGGCAWAIKDSNTLQSVRMVSLRINLFKNFSVCFGAVDKCHPLAKSIPKDWYGLYI